MMVSYIITSAVDYKKYLSLYERGLKRNSLPRQEGST